MCYINAEHEEECFRNEYETHNVFEMGFDIIQKDILDDKHHAERHHEFTVDPKSHPDHNIDAELLKKYGVDLDDLREHLHGQHTASDTHDIHDIDPLQGHGLD